MHAIVKVYFCLHSACPLPNCAPNFRLHSIMHFRACPQNCGGYAHFLYMRGEKVTCTSKRRLLLLLGCVLRHFSNLRCVGCNTCGSGSVLCSRNSLFVKRKWFSESNRECRSERSQIEMHVSSH